MTALNHLGLTVRDIEASIRFYRDVVGMDLVRQREPKVMGDWYDELTSNRPGSVVASAHLRLGELTLQLLEYSEPDQPPARLHHGAAGSPHLCFDVVDVESRRTSVIAAGYEPTAIIAIMGGPMRSFYVPDPDGLPVELLQPA